MAVTDTSETLPADPKAAIRQIKQELRAQIGDVQAVFDRLTARLEEIDALKASGQDVWPLIPFEAIARGQVTEAQDDSAREYGKTETYFDTSCKLFKNLPAQGITWMSHGDSVQRSPEGFTDLARDRKSVV